MPLIKTSNFKKEFVLKQLPSSRAIQKTFIDYGAKKVYALQLRTDDPSKDVVMSVGDFPSSGNVVLMNQHSPMILQGFGHGETLEKANNTYDSGDWFWITTGATGSIQYPSFAPDGMYWGRQIGLLKFEEGGTINYTDVKRISAISYLTETQNSYGKLLRTDAALSSTTGRLIIMGQATNGTRYLSCYKEEKVIEALYNKSSNNVLAGDKATVFTKGAKGTGYISAYEFTHAAPYGSQQGLEFNDGNKVFISGGGTGKYPHILKGDWRFTSGNYQTLQLDFTGTDLADVETEGIQLHGNYIYIGLEFHHNNPEPHRIYSVPKSEFTV